MPLGNIGALRVGATPKLPNIPILGGIFSTVQPWVLTNLDNRQEVVQGDFFPENITLNKSANYAQTTSLNRARPITQYSGGNLTTITFDALLFARHFLDKLEDRVEILLNATERDDKLRRPPVWLFEGANIALECVILSVGGIRIAETRNNGSFRSVDFKISLQEYVPFNVEAIKESTPGTPEPSTFFKKVKQGDTFEKIAERQYDDPMKGVHLRSINTSAVGLGLDVGEELKILPATHSEIRAPVTPVSSQISRGEAPIKALFEKRGGKRLSYSFR